MSQLHLGNNKIGDLGVAALAESLESYRKLEVLDLSFNNIGIVGVHALAKALKGYSRLVSLKLDNNNIKDLGAKCIGAVMPTLISVTELNVGFNAIGGEGNLILLSTSKEPTCKLRCLVLSGNEMTSDLAIAISTHLTEDTRLKELYLDHMNISQTCEQSITAGILACKSLSLVKFSGFRLGPNVDKVYKGMKMGDITNEQVLSILRARGRQILVEHMLNFGGCEPTTFGNMELVKAEAVTSSFVSSNSSPIMEARVIQSHGQPILSTNSSSYAFKENVVGIADVNMRSSFVLNGEEIAALLSVPKTGTAHAL